MVLPISRIPTTAKNPTPARRIPGDDAPKPNKTSCTCYGDESGHRRGVHTKNRGRRRVVHGDREFLESHESRQEIVLAWYANPTRGLPQSSRRNPKMPPEQYAATGRPIESVSMAAAQALCFSSYSLNGATEEGEKRRGAHLLIQRTTPSYGREDRPSRCSTTPERLGTAHDHSRAIPTLAEVGANAWSHKTATCARWARLANGPNVSVRTRPRRS